MNDIPLKEVSNIKNISCEYLVVGSGAGGSVAAYEFSKANKDTLLIEEGSNYKIDYFKGSIANSFLKVWRNAGFTPVIGKTSFGFGEGKCLGGSTFINGGRYVFSNLIFDYFPSEKQFSLEYHFFPELVKQSHIISLMVDSKSFDIGTPARLFDAREILKRKLND